MSADTTNDWPKVALGDLLLDIQTGFASGVHNVGGTGVPHLRPMNVSADGHIDRGVLKFVSGDLADRPARRLRRGDVLFNNTNSPELVGKSAIFDDNDEPAFSNHMTRLRVDETRLDPRFLALRLHQAWREGWFSAHCNNHVSQASIGRDVLRGFEISLPPLSVQREISTFSNLVDDRRSSCSAHLADARRAIERFRDAVLADAIAGRLTDGWRLRNHPTASAAEPVGSIGVARRKLRDTTQTEVASAPEGDDLPESWAWVTFGSVIDELRNGVPIAPAIEPPGVPILRISAVRPGHVDLDDLRFLRNDVGKWGSFALREGDVLFTRYNGSSRLVGVCGVVRGLGDRVVLHPDKLIRVRFDHDLVMPEYVEIFFSAPAARARMTAGSVSSAGQQGVSGATVRSQPLALPPLKEQREIVGRVTKLLDLAQLFDARISGAATRLDRTQQAVVARSLRGNPSPYESEVANSG